MEYDPFYSGRAGDGLPLSNQNRSARGHIAGKKNPTVGGLPYTSVENDMQCLIHRLEQEAYSSVLRALNAQSDLITWEKESLVFDLRKELVISYDEHRDLLRRINGDGIIQKIREWRQSGGLLSGFHDNDKPNCDTVSRATVSAPHKKQKASQSDQTLPGSYTHAGPSGRGQATNKSASRAREAKMSWSDNNFHKAVISDYDATKGLHLLSYDTNTSKENSEGPIMMRWSMNGPGRVVQKWTGQKDATPAVARGNGFIRIKPKLAFLPSKNGTRRKSMDEIKMLNTETLIKEVKESLDATHPDPLEIEKAKKLLNEHEQSLLDVIASLPES